MKYIRRFALAALLALAVLWALGCSQPPQEESSPTTPTQYTTPATEASETAAPPTETSVPPAVTEETSAPSTEAAQPPTVRSTTPSEAPTEATRTQAKAPVYRVDESYFNDALFIGDSLTVGMVNTVRLGSADYFCKGGMSVYSMFSVTTSDIRYSDQNLETLLASHSYGKIYVALGVNDAGQTVEAFRAKYIEHLSKIRSLQPDAIIILQGIIPVSRSKVAANSYYRVEHLDAFTQIISSFADNKTVFFIDPSEIYEDEEGYLPEEYAPDGVHLYSQYYEHWARFICENAIVF